MTSPAKPDPRLPQNLPPTVEMIGPNAAEANHDVHGVTPAASANSTVPVPGVLLARGGMGCIWRVHDADLGRDVAMKVLREEHADNPVLRWRFVREARLTGQLQHPGVVPVYELGRLPDERPYFTMKLIGGTTLAELLAERPNPDEHLPRLLRVFEAVAQALAYAHAHGVIHRDLKPANVMVGDFGEVQVMDWGVAKELTDPSAPVGGPTLEPDPGDGQHTVAGSILGTPAYMPPEQARGQIDRVDPRSDVFGLGAILCQVLTGHPPYLGIDGKELVRQARRGDLRPVYRRLDHCRETGPMVALAKQCLSADRDHRPPHAGAVAEAVTSHLESELRRAERDLVRFFELSLDLFCIAGTDGHFHRVNENFTRVLGHTTADLLARPYLDYVHPDDRGATVTVMGNLARGLPCVRFRNRYADANGVYRWFEWTAKAIPDEGVIFAVARDVTVEYAPA